MLERDGELTVLRWELAHAADGRGRLVRIEAPAGAGKSTLLHAATAAAEERGLRVLAARAGEFERDFAFGIVRQLLEPVLRGAGTGGLLDGPAAPAAWVVTPPRDGAGTQFAVLNGLHWLVVGLAEREPLLIAVDDVHWADEASLRFLDFLARRVADLPVALLVTQRPAEPGAPAGLLEALADHPGATTLAPAPLSPAAVATLVRAQRPDAADDLVAACHAATAGNPLYVRELLAARPASAAEVQEVSIPALADRVWRRVERLGAGATELATAMAILGDGSPLRLAAALAERDPAEAAVTAQALRRIDLLASDDPVAFTHPLLRRAIHDRAAPAQRAAAARLLDAEGAPAERVADHLSALAPSGSAEVATRLLEIAREALAKGAPEIAVARLERSLAEQAGTPPRALLLLELGRAQVALGDARAIESLGAAQTLADEPALERAAASALVEVLAMFGQWRDAVAVIDAARDGHDPALLADLEAVRAGIMANDPALVAGFDGARPDLEAIARGSSWGARALAALLGAVSAYRGEGPARSRPWAEHALADGVLVAERGGGGWAAALALDLLMTLDDHTEALALASAVEAAGRASGSVVGLITGAGYRAAVDARRGDVGTAANELRELVELCEQSGMQIWLTTAALLFLDVLVERPGFEDLAALIDGVELDPQFAATASGAELAETQGRLALARGDRVLATARLRHAESIYRPLGHGPARTPWMSALALAIAPDAPEAAAALADEELALARRHGLARPEGIALRTAGQLAWIQAGAGAADAPALREAGLERLQASVDRLRGSGVELELARSLVELGAAHRRLHRRSSAREHLSDGLALASTCGADRLAARAADELRAAGFRPQTRPRSGVAALTVAEERVAALAAAGRSNVEIARELYVSLKTVETHLSSAYAKLGLSGRGARERLRAALAGPPGSG